jgi:hypothetical protein
MSTYDTTSSGNSTGNVRVGIIIPHYNEPDEMVINAANSVVGNGSVVNNIILSIVTNRQKTISGLLTEQQTQKLEDNEIITIGKIKDIQTVVIENGKEETYPTLKNKGIISIWHSVKYFMFLPAYSTITSDKITKHLSLLESDSRIGIVYNDYLFHQLMGGDSIYQMFLEPFDRHRLENKTTIPETLTISKQAIEKSGLFDKELELLDIWDLCLRITENFIAVHIPEFLDNILYNKDLPNSMESEKAKIIEKLRNRNKNV